MDIKQVSNEQIATAKRFISPDAFFIIVANALCRKEKLSAIRMGDGEKALMLYAQGKPMWDFLRDEGWLKEYGLWGADLKQVGEMLIKAANDADWFCPNIYGVQKGNYDVIGMVKPRQLYVEGLYTYAWGYMGRADTMLKYDGGAGIVCRNAKIVAENLQKKYGIEKIEYAEYSNWTDYATALQGIMAMKAGLVLCSTGAGGKYLPIEAANITGKVILDAGSAMIKHWQ